MRPRSTSSEWIGLTGTCWRRLMALVHCKSFHRLVWCMSKQSVCRSTFLGGYFFLQWWGQKLWRIGVSLRPVIRDSVRKFSELQDRNKPFQFLTQNLWYCKSSQPYAVFRWYQRYWDGAWSHIAFTKTLSSLWRRTPTWFDFAVEVELAHAYLVVDISYYFPPIIALRQNPAEVTSGKRQRKI